MADGWMGGCRLGRARRAARWGSLIALVVLGITVVVAPRPAAAIPSGSSSPQAAEPQAIDDYQPATPSYAGAPWFEPSHLYDQNFPDPDIVWDGSRYWAYSTSTGGPRLPAMWSTDLAAWTARDAYDPNPYNSDAYFNDAFPVPPDWSLGGPTVTDGKSQWAPSVAAIGGGWVAYSSWERSPGKRCISVARSSSPAGPFVDVSSTPLVCDSGPAGSIDPEPFFDSSGRPWLTWKAEAGGGLPPRIYSQALSADGLSLKAGSTPRLLLVSVYPWEGGVVENPSMAYRDGAYWLLYSGNAWDSSRYRMGVARCAGPRGPCDRVSSSPLFGNTSSDLGPGGGSLFVDPSGRMRLAYHVWNAPYTSYPSDPNCDGPGVCSSQGQRFLRVDGVAAWDGRLTVDPVGAVDSITAGGGRVAVTGWTLDPSDPAPIVTQVHVDGTRVDVRANRPRPDVAAAFPGLGARHGFSVSIPANPGRHQVCAYGLHVGAGRNHRLGCRSIFVPSGPPIGALDVVSARPGGLSVAGWAADPDAAGAIPVHVYVDGVGVVLKADGSRPDVAGAKSWVGAEHGYSATVPASPGRHQVCAWGINVGAGANTLLGCRSATVPGGSPIGSLDTVGGSPTGVSVAGWALDPDTAAPIDVHVYVDGRGVAVRADRPRPDVGAAFGAYGSRHGFSATVPTGPGYHSVCAFAIDVGGGGNTALGCRTVVVKDTSPIGSLDRATPVNGGVSVAGWALDPDTAAPIDVHVYVDATGTALRADQSRPDVGDAFPGYGSGHGYGATIGAPPGTHTVCAYGINVAGGVNRALGCRVVTVS